MLACVGCAAAEMLPTVIDRKRQIHAWYEKYTNRPELEAVKLQTTGEGDCPVWWVNSALMPEGISGEEVGMQLMKDYPDIEIRPGFFPLDQQKIFKYPTVKHCPNSDALFRRLICMPSSVKLKEEQVERVCTALAASLKVVSERSSSS
jgi:dTDP-4-amino-4,6-dideoxygalactose transaminase